MALYTLTPELRHQLLLALVSTAIALVLWRLSEMLLSWIFQTLMRWFGGERCTCFRNETRCIYEQGHPGKHRDSYGDYWG